MYCLTAGFASLKRDQLQFSYKANKATADTITTVLHAALSHTDKQGSYVRMLCGNFSLAFSTILPNILTKKLTDGFLTDHPQAARVGLSIHSTLRTGSILSPFLVTLYAHDTQTSMVGLISSSEETAYREEVQWSCGVRSPNAE